MSAATPWTYQPPSRPAGYQEQCYYRTSGQAWRHSIHVPDRLEGDPMLQLYRAADRTDVRLTAEFERSSLNFELSAASLRTLHAAIGDALQDIAAVEADRELQESFDRISEEMREADELGGPRCYYSHPDIHYVAPGQVEAKVRELEAAGCKRYMVLPNEQIVDAELDGAAA